MRAWLAVVVSGTLILGGLAIPLKLARSHPSRAAVGSLTNAITVEIQRAIDYKQASTRLERLHEGLPAKKAALIYIGADGEKITPERIRRFLARQASPMTRYSTDIMKAGLRYRVDPRVIVAIAGVESTFGIHSRGHNAWGWNGGRTRWSSWAVAIDRYTQGISSKYRSLRTGRFAAASRTYCPPCGLRWGRKALGIFRRI